MLLEAGAAGFTTMTPFVLLAWGPVVGLEGGAIAGLAGSAALERAQIGERVGEGFRREQRLKDLYKAGSVPAPLKMAASRSALIAYPPRPGIVTILRSWWRTGLLMR